MHLLFKQTYIHSVFFIRMTLSMSSDTTYATAAKAWRVAAYATSKHVRTYVCATAHCHFTTPSMAPAAMSQYCCTGEWICDILITNQFMLWFLCWLDRGSHVGSQSVCVDSCCDSLVGHRSGHTYHVLTHAVTRVWVTCWVTRIML